LHGTLYAVNPDQDPDQSRPSERELILNDRALLDRLGVPRTVLHPAPDPNVSLLEGLAQRIVDHLPDGVADECVLCPTEQLVQLEIGGSVTANLLEFVDLKGARWVALFGYCMSFLDDAVSPEEGYDLSNSLNVSTTGFTWVYRPGALLLIFGTSARIDRPLDAWVKFTARNIVDATAKSTMALSSYILEEPDREHPAVSYHESESLLADAAEHRFTNTDVSVALDRYISSVPEQLRPFVGLEYFQSTAFVRVPFHMREGQGKMVLRVAVVNSGDILASWASPGVHLMSEFPVPMSLEDSQKWCAVFNGESASQDLADRGQFNRTTAWLLGNWRYVDEGDGSARLLYHGYVPNTARYLVDLAEVLDGTVREVWASWDRFRLELEFSSALHDGGVIDLDWPADDTM
jgi:hypothetical protein